MQHPMHSNPASSEAPAVPTWWRTHVTAPLADMADRFGAQARADLAFTEREAAHR